jgi:hypothetical protein
MINKTILQKKLPRFKRSGGQKPPLALQPRDKEIIKLVFDHRFLNTEQITYLTGDSTRTIQRRLQKLFHHKFLDRPRQQFTSFRNNSMIYACGDRGADVLAEDYGLDRGKINWRQKNNEVGERQLNHSMMISDFRVNLILALKDSKDTTLMFWKQGVARELRDSVVVKGEKEPIPFNPDAFFGIRAEGGKLFFFLEADYSTMTHKYFFRKMKGYFHFWQQRKGSEKFGIKLFKVLTITKSQQRAKNLRKISKEADGGIGFTGFFFTSNENYNAEDPQSVLKPIWQTPADKTQHHLLE